MNRVAWILTICVALGLMGCHRTASQQDVESAASASEGPFAAANALRTDGLNPIEALLRKCDECFDKTNEVCLHSDYESCLEPGELDGTFYYTADVWDFLDKHGSRLEKYGEVTHKYFECMSELPSGEERQEPDEVICGGYDYDTISSILHRVEEDKAHIQWLKDARRSQSDFALWKLLESGKDDRYTVAEFEEKLLELVKTGADLRAPNWDNELPVFSTSSKYVLSLIAAGADPQVTNNGDTLLHAYANDVQVVEGLVALGLDINAQNKAMQTPIFFVDPANVELFRYYVEKGADIHVRDAHGDSLLHSRGNSPSAMPKERIELLLKAGLDVHWRNDDGRTPVFGCVSYGELDTECLDTMKKAGADIHAVDNNGDTLLSLLFAQGQYPFDALVEKKSDLQPVFPHVMARVRAASEELVYLNNPLVEYDQIEMDSIKRILPALIDAGFDVNTRDEENNTLLFYVDDAETASLLIRAGIDVHARNLLGETALNHATSYPRRGALEAMIAAGADVNTRDNVGYAPLFTHIPTDRGWDFGTITYNSFEIPKLLLQHGADIHARDRDGKNLLFYSFEECADWERDCNPKEFYALLLRRGVDPRILDKFGRNAAFYNIHCFFDENGKPNEYATKYDLKKLVNTPDYNGTTPIMVARTKDDVEKYILAGADLLAKDNAGRSVLDYHKNNPGVTELLLDAGAK